MEKNMRASLLILLMLPLITAPCVLAADTAECRAVGGAISTNFIDQSATLGTATGDLRGGLGVDVLGVGAGANGSTVFHNHHHWVTESGDTIFLADADATAFPTGVPGLFGTSYIDGVKIVGGTGQFAGTSGNLAIFGAVNLNQGQVILRYQGQICGPSSSAIRSTHTRLGKAKKTREL
jgi:hypothetical protein